MKSTTSIEDDSDPDDPDYCEDLQDSDQVADSDSLSNSVNSLQNEHPGFQTGMKTTDDEERQGTEKNPTESPERDPVTETLGDDEGLQKLNNMKNLADLLHRENGLKLKLFDQFPIVIPFSIQEDF